MAMLAETRRKKFYALCPKGKPLFEDENRFGSKMLKKMGWSKGKGLGANEDGSQEFVRIRYKNDADGLGYDQRDDQWTQHEEHFNNILQSLNASANNSDDNDNGNTKTNGIEDDFVTKGFGFKESADTNGKKVKLKEKLSGESLEEKSMKSRKRVHYKKFTKGKDLTQYSEKDLANIFGKKAVDDEEKVNQNNQPSPDDVYKQLNGFTIGDKQNEDEEKLSHFAGVTTIKQTLSIHDYFKQKMESLKSRKNPVGDSSPPDLEVDEQQPSEEISLFSKKKKSKKKMSENDDEQKEAVDQEDSSLPLDVVDSSKNICKKKKKKSPEKEELEQLNSSLFLEADDEVSKNNCKKKKKKKHMDIENPEEILKPNAEELFVKKRKSNDNLLEEDVSVLEVPFKKPKKKRKESCEAISNEADISIDCDLPKKKSKKSEKSLEVENDAEIPVDIEPLELSRKKKIKKSKIDCEETTINDDCDLHSEETKSKKSKKSKNSIPSQPSQDIDQQSESMAKDFLDTPLVASEVTLDLDSTDSKKKKKKSKDLKNSLPTEALPIEKPFEADIPKRKSNDNLLEEDVSVLEVPFKKPKTKRKESCEAISNEADISVDCDLPKKKSKKSEKSLEVENYAEIPVDIEPLELSRKKKIKKSKIDCEDTTINGDCDLHSEETKSKKSKKSKNSIPSQPSQHIDQQSESMAKDFLDSPLVASEVTLDLDSTDSKKKKKKSKDLENSLPTEALPIEKPFEADIPDLKEPKRKKNKKTKCESQFPEEPILSAESLESKDKDTKGNQSKLSATNEDDSEEDQVKSEEINDENNENEEEKSSLSCRDDDLEEKVYVRVFRPPADLEDCEKILNSYNIFKLSQFNADKFALLQFENFKGSNLSSLAGYGFDENLILNILPSKDGDHYYEKLMHYEEKKKFREKSERKIQKYKRKLEEKLMKMQNEEEEMKLQAEKAKTGNVDTLEVDNKLPDEDLINENEESISQKDSSNEQGQENDLPSSSSTSVAVENPLPKVKRLKNSSLKKKLYVRMQEKRFHDKRKRRNAFSGI